MSTESEAIELTATPLGHARFWAANRLPGIEYGYVTATMAPITWLDPQRVAQVMESQPALAPELGYPYLTHEETLTALPLVFPLAFGAGDIAAAVDRAARDQSYNVPTWLIRLRDAYRRVHRS